MLLVFNHVVNISWLDRLHSILCTAYLSLRYHIFFRVIRNTFICEKSPCQVLLIITFKYIFFLHQP